MSEVSELRFIQTQLHISILRFISWWSYSTELLLAPREQAAAYCFLGMAGYLFPWVTRTPDSTDLGTQAKVSVTGRSPCKAVHISSVNCGTKPRLRNDTFLRAAVHIPQLKKAFKNHTNQNKTLLWGNHPYSLISPCDKRKLMKLT